MSALSIPRSSDPLTELVGSLLGKLGPVSEIGDLAPAIKYKQDLAPLAGFSHEEAWARLQALRSGAPMAEEGVDLLRPEWHMLTQPQAAPTRKDFSITADAVPEVFTAHLRHVVRPSGCVRRSR